MPLEPRPFDLVDRQFRTMCSGRNALCVTGTLLGGRYIGREVPLLEVREVLLQRGTGYGTQNRVLAELVCRARDGEPWRTALAGVLLPGLRARVGRITRTHPWHAVELEVEALAGLFEALPGLRLERGHIAASLIWAARRSADRFLDRELAESTRRVRYATRVRLLERLPALDDEDADDEKVDDIEEDDLLGGERVGAGVPGHPDTVLEEARVAGVLTAAEVDVIGATRVARVPARDYARDLGAGLGSVRLKRYRAEQRLVAWLAER